MHEWVVKKVRHGSSLPELARVNDASFCRSPKKVIRIQELRVEKLDENIRKGIKGTFLS